MRWLTCRLHNRVQHPESAKIATLPAGAEALGRN